MSKFKDAQGRWHTQGLFLECYSASTKAIEPMFTLKDHEYKGLPSIKQIFIQLEDPTGYRLATEHLGGWKHWVKLTKLGWFQKHLEEWQEELEVKMKCASIQKMVELTKGDGSVASSATKFLVNKEWEATKRGRPSKAEVEKQIKIDASVNKELDQDFKILGLDVK